MPFCAPIWSLFFKGEQHATNKENEACRERLEKGNTTGECTSKPCVEGKSRALTKEEQLKEQRRKDIAQLREILRRRRELLDGVVEVPLKKGNIEGYQIRVVRGSSQGVVMRSPGNEPTKESMEKFSRFIESKIKEKEEGAKSKAKAGKAFNQEKPGTAPKDPVQDALIKRLLELQAEKDGKKKAQPEPADRKKRKDKKSGKDHSKKYSPMTPKDARKEECHETKEGSKKEKPVDLPPENHESDLDESLEPPNNSEEEHRKEDYKPHVERSDRDKDNSKIINSTDGGKKGKRKPAEAVGKKEAGKVGKITRDSSPKTKDHSKGNKSKDHWSPKQKHGFEPSEPFDELPHKTTEPKEENGRNPNSMVEHSKARDNGEKHDGTSCDMEEMEEKEHAKADVGNGGSIAEQQRKSIKSKKSKDKK